MERILVSACLLGVPCRYDGRAKPCAAVRALEGTAHLVPVCPEVSGGLPTPRPPAERVGKRVVTQAGSDVTDAYQRGAQACLDLAREAGARRAVLKAKSPACGVGKIYDGTFGGTLVAGNGVLAEMLLAEGLEAMTEDDLERRGMGAMAKGTTGEASS